MSIYVIDFSEPLATGFDVLPGSYNGPGMSSPQTSLRLYGRGAVEWGEGVNEDLVRLVENFASATPPSNPINGQLWAETKLYHYDGANYWRFDPDVPAGPWVIIPGQPFATSEPVSPTEGTYYTTGGKLYGYYTQKPNTTADWIERSFSTGPLNSVTDKPEVVIKAYNAFTNAWTQPLPVVVATTANQPTSPVTGTMWYDTTVSTLYVYDGTNWLPVLTGSPSTGDLDMAGDRINFSNLFLNEGNGSFTNTGPDIRGTGTLALAAQGDLTLVVDYDNDGGGAFVVSKGALTASDVNYDSLFTVLNTGEVRATTPNYETLVLNTNSLTNKKYVDDAIAAVTGSIPSVSALVRVFTVGTSATYKAGDIAVIGGVIYIAIAAGTSTIPSANWKQVFPAQYS